MSKKRRFVGVQSLEVTRVADRTYAFGVYQDHNFGRIPFAAFAEKSEEDKDNPTLGYEFAVGRAFENLGKEMQKRGWNRIQTHKEVVEPAPAWTAEQIEEARNTPLAKQKIAKRARKAAKNGTAKTSTGEN